MSCTVTGGAREALQFLHGLVQSGQFLVAVLRMTFEFVKEIHYFAHVAVDVNNPLG